MTNSTIKALETELLEELANELKQYIFTEYCETIKNYIEEYEFFDKDLKNFIENMIYFLEKVNDTEWASYGDAELERIDKEIEHLTDKMFEGMPSQRDLDIKENGLYWN